ncbi:MAG: ABC transporter permease [Acidobacteria bacterium]|nr:ABC transporter permease [Acidobacteriota bacterium]MBV9474570.1 ABC transporter permease [Acidobacteriota bacterium]
MFTENLKIALRAIRANKMRSILTVLGVMIGVAAVIAVVSIVQGFQYKISNDLNQIGASFIEVFPQGDRRNPFQVPELTIDDAAAVRRQTTSIRDFTPIFVTSGETRHGDARHSVQVYAVNRSYPEIVNHWVDRGRFFTPVDEEQRKRVCVVGIEVVKELELGDEPIGKIIQIDANTFTIVGVLEKKGGSLGGNQDDIVIIPFPTAVVLYGSQNMRALVLAFQMDQNADLELTKNQVRDVLRARHNIAKEKPDDFRILAQEEILETVSTVLGSVTWIMGAVVGVALLVGGIGIMNIMLVSVTERTREIGIRKSIGARRLDVLIQFVIEAIVLSSLGGLIGIIGGFLLATLTRFIIGRWIDLPPVHTPFWAIGGAFAFCGFLGILFGIYPAAKASKLDPIEALRYE